MRYNERQQRCLKILELDPEIWISRAELQEAVLEYSIRSTGLPKTKRRNLARFKQAFSGFTFRLHQNPTSGAGLDAIKLVIRKKEAKEKTARRIEEGTAGRGVGTERTSRIGGARRGETRETEEEDDSRNENVIFWEKK